jgi:hypothetical protein
VHAPTHAHALPPKSSSVRAQSKYLKRPMKDLLVCFSSFIFTSSKQNTITPFIPLLKALAGTAATGYFRSSSLSEGFPGVERPVISTSLVPVSPNQRRCVQQLFLTRLLEDILYSRPQWEYSPHVFSLGRIHYGVMDDSQRTQGVTARSRGAFKCSGGCGLWPRVQTR